MYTRAEKNGKWGEIYAVRMLRDEKNYEIVACNYRVRGGEIDVIAIHKEFLVFVEVKTRGRNAIAAPREWITEGKRKKIIYTAKCFMAYDRRDLQPRFDVVEVILDDSSVPPRVLEINHIEDAFRCEDEIF